MTNSFILFIFGMFEDTEDIEFYCNEVLLENPAVKSLRFIVENSKNLIVILDSDKTQKELSKSLHKDLLDQNVKFYFIFRRDEVVAAHIPEQVKKFIYGEVSDEEKYISVQYTKVSKVDSLDLDEVLEKIKNNGIDSLTKDEKKFLDNFDY
jgi:signal recognition particle receptor subunit beta